MPQCTGSRAASGMVCQTQALTPAIAAINTLLTTSSGLEFIRLTLLPLCAGERHERRQCVFHDRRVELVHDGRALPLGGHEIGMLQNREMPRQRRLCDREMLG